MLVQINIQGGRWELEGVVERRDTIGSGMCDRPTSQLHCHSVGELWRLPILPRLLYVLSHLPHMSGEFLSLDSPSVIRGKFQLGLWGGCGKAFSPAVALSSLTANRSECAYESSQFYCHRPNLFHFTKEAGIAKRTQRTEQSGEMLNGCSKQPRLLGLGCLGGEVSDGRCNETVTINKPVDACHGNHLLLLCLY